MEGGALRSGPTRASRSREAGQHQWLFPREQRHWRSGARRWCSARGVPTNWKLSPADFKERAFWNQYVQAYNEILSETSHKHAPWFAIPSVVKWYRNIAISEIIVQAMKGLKLAYPAPVMDVSKIKL